MTDSSAVVAGTNATAAEYNNLRNDLLNGKRNITTDTDGATITFDLDNNSIHQVVLGGNRTLALSNVNVGQVFILRLVQDATGNRVPVWFTTIKWAAGSAPVLSTGANAVDVFGFICTSANNYDGFIIGQNLS